jgi:hypothetical protein
MNRALANRFAVAVFAAAFSLTRVVAQEPVQEPVFATAPVAVDMVPKSQLTDLTLANFFSAGWDEPSEKRVRATGTPDFALLRVQTNFMEREFRFDYQHQENVNSKKTASIDTVDALIAYAFNRRFMIEVVGTYQGNDGRGTNADVDGGFPSLVGRVQLIDTESSSYSFNFKLNAPNRGIGETQTSVSYGYGGFEDLGYWLNLDRVGFYHSVFFSTFDGPAAAGTRRNNVAYDVSIAKTLTSPETPIFGSFTLFVEAFAQTDLDGATEGHTLGSITPACRFNLGKFTNIQFGKDNWILIGADLPVVGPRPWDVLYRVSYIVNF